MDLKCSPDNLSAAIDEILNGYYRDCSDAIEVGVDKTTKKARGYVKKYAKSASFKKRTVAGRYIGGFSSKVSKEGANTYGEVGNRSLPGLVHLLEKGHAKIGGGRTTAYPHMEPAFNDAKGEFVDTMKKELDKI